MLFQLIFKSIFKIKVGKDNATARASDDINLQHRFFFSFSFDPVLGIPVLSETIKGCLQLVLLLSS